MGEKHSSLYSSDQGMEAGDRRGLAGVQLVVKQDSALWSSALPSPPTCCTGFILEPQAEWTVRERP